MKKNFIAALAFAALPFCLMAQDVRKDKLEKEEMADKKEKTEKKEKAEKKESREIIIRQKGDKDIKLKVEINGDEVTVNGKPLADFKDDDITINKRKIIITDGDNKMYWNFSPDGGEFDLGGLYNEDLLRKNGDLLGKPESENDRIHSAFLGVTTEEDEGGAKITEVIKGSAAQKAGLQKGDIITKVADEKITGPEVLSDVIGFKKPKDEVKITFKRAGKESTVKAILGGRKTAGVKSYSFSSPRGRARTFTMPGIAPDVNMEGFGQFDMPSIAGMDGFEMFGRQKRIGLKLQDTEDGVGVKVINVEDSSTAAIAGLKKDDVITEINERKIDNTDDAREELIPEEGKKAYKIKALRNGTEMTFDVKIPRKLKTADF